jgi:hypothetical protein
MYYNIERSFTLAKCLARKKKSKITFFIQFQTIINIDYGLHKPNKCSGYYKNRLPLSYKIVLQKNH